MTWVELPRKSLDKEKRNNVDILLVFVTLLFNYRAAGFMKSVTQLKPSHLKVVMYLSMVRNSVGSGAYVADEIITAPSGRRVLVVNTDAEGRMVMGDALHYLKKELLESLENQKYKDADTTLHTVATLTGHAALAVGQYPIAMDNGPARRKNVAERLRAAGDLYGEPFEISTLRREDFQFVTPKVRLLAETNRCVACSF